MGNNNRSSIPYIIYIVPYIISIPILIFLYQSYYKFQASVFSNDNTILFAHDTVSSLIIFFSPPIIIFCIILSIKNIITIKIMKIKFFSFIAIIIFVISTFIVVCKFFEYTDINKDGISVKNSIFFTDKNYMWSDVKYAEVSYKHVSKSNLEIIYNIYLNDGTVVNVRESNDFFSKIIYLDDFIKNKKIGIVRSTLEAKDYSRFEDALKGKDKEVSDNAQVVLQILNK